MLIKRGAIIGIGTALLVSGLTGLGLLQTGVIFPTESSEHLNLPETKPAEPIVENSQKPQGSAGQTGQPAVAAKNGAEPGRPAGRSIQSAGTPSNGPGQVLAQSGQQPSAGKTASEDAVPVPMVGKGERRYPAVQPEQAPERLAKPAAPLRSTRPNAAKPKFDEKRFRAQLKSGPKRYAAGPEAKHSTARAPSARVVRGDSKKPIVIRFSFDPAQRRNLDVAQVHLGDRIRVNVKPVGPVGRRVYFTFLENINSPQGAVLELETMYSFERPVAYMQDRGYYVIEVKIYPNNRWNILPRSYV